MTGPLDDLIKALKMLPGVGEKTATRYAFALLNAPDDEVGRLLTAIDSVKRKLTLCSRCFNLTETDPCRVCTDTKRDRTRICVVETPLDLLAVDKGGSYRGLFHVLHGVLTPLEAIGPDDIRLRELIDRVHQGSVEEVIIALNPTVEGESTATFIRERLKDAHVRVTRIAYGIPVGGSLEYSDPLTLSRAFENRTPV